MKKLLLLTLLLPLMAACKKKMKENVVRYKVDGMERTVKGSYSQINFKGIEYGVRDGKLGFSAYTSAGDYISVGGFDLGLSTGQYLEFDSAMFNTTTNKMFLVQHLQTGSSREFGSLERESGGLTLSKNNTDIVSGTFSGMLYTYNKTNSVYISDGYFYLNK
ncbi:MAG TPA: hypothetical protein PKX92_00225 [Edaphocola sp.]|nr:hypothetical protein [Edaphocola sp.]